MILGYSIEEGDLKCNMLDELRLTECGRFSNIYDLNILNSEFKIKNRKLDIGCTYDGFSIVSPLFKQFCIDEKYPGLEFLPLPNAPISIGLRFITY